MKAKWIATILTVLAVIVAADITSAIILRKSANEIGEQVARSGEQIDDAKIDLQRRLQRRANLWLVVSTCVYSGVAVAVWRAYRHFRAPHHDNDFVGHRGQA
jgi:hypothetical protein